MKEYEEAIKRNPEVAKYYGNLGLNFVKLMEFQRAKESYEIALKKDPSFIKTYHRKGDCHYFLKEYHKALESYEAGLKLEGNNLACKQGIEKTQAAIYANNSAEDQEIRAKKAMADPEIQVIMNTPEVRNALSEMEKDPKCIQNIMKNPSLAAKIQKLIEAGILRTG